MGVHTRITYLSALVLLSFGVVRGVSAQLDCAPLHILTGDTLDFLGWSVAGAGDLNRDGYDDFLVSAIWGGVDQEGAVTVISGINGSVLFEFKGEHRRDLFGASIAGAHDVNNDGYPDILVGAPANDNSDEDAGSVYVFSGLNGDTLYVFHGELSGSWFGKEVAFCGDFNNDGSTDIIVGAQFDDAVDFNSGSVYVFSGLDGSVLLKLNGSAFKHQLGQAVAGVGDVNSDGFDDIIVEGHQTYVISGATGDTLYEFITGGTLSVDGAGDVNNDGVPDIIIGAVYKLDTLGATFSRGRVYIHSGLNGDTLYVFTGMMPQNPNRSAFFGLPVTGLGDFNGDGFDDFAVGAQSDNPDTDRAGRVYVFSGKTGDTLAVLAGEISDAAFGRSISSAGDVNGDGQMDIVIGSRYYHVGDLVTGRAYVYDCRDFQTSVESSHENSLPSEFELGQNYPNPFNPSTKIDFQLARASEWSITIYDVTGRTVREFSGFAGVGTVSVEWDASERASGIYFYKARAGAFEQTRKMMLLK